MLDNRGLEYTTVDVTESEVALRFVKDVLGYQAAPVVYTSQPEEQPDGSLSTIIEHWTQFQPDRIKAIVK